MNKTVKLFAIVAILLFSKSAFSQEEVKPLADQKILLKSKNPQLAKNKKLVYDFWREVFEGGHLELADKYMTETYIQHNPNVPTGRKAFVDFFSKFAQPHPIEKTIKGPVVTITAEGDIVLICFVSKQPDPSDSTKTYTTTSFDMFRIENGKIAEHWDAAPKMKF